MKTPRLSKKILKKRKRREWEAVEEMAEYFQVSKRIILEEINGLGRLVNKILLRLGGRVFFVPLEGRGEEEKPVGFVKNKTDLIDLGLAAYYSWRDESFYSLQVYVGNKGERWYPKKHIISEKELALVLKY